MILNKEEITIVDVTTDNVSEVGIYCIKDKKSAGFQSKVTWFKSTINAGLNMKIAYKGNKQVGFIEYFPSEFAWRPVNAQNYLFIQCIALFVKDAKGKGIASQLIQCCEQDAKNNNKSGICAMSSQGAWIANKSLYEKNGFTIVEQKDRFELMVKSFDNLSPTPTFFDWKKAQKNYIGWNLVYADQCPWHEKAVVELQRAALDFGIELKVKKLNSPAEAQQAPSGFGTFNLLKDCKLIEDHYISRTRFENIIKQEIKRT